MITANNFSGKFERDLTEVCAKSPYGAKILSCFKTYHGKNYDFLGFWLQLNAEGKAVCAFCRYYTSVTVCAVDVDKTEAEMFLNMLSPEFVFCDDALDLELYSDFFTGETMRCAKLLPNERINRDAAVQKLCSDTKPLKDVYDLLSRSGASISMPEFDAYYLDTSHGIRSGVMELYAVYSKSGEIISTAAVAAKSADSAVIGCVATDERYRRQGLAGAVVTAATKSVLSAGMTAYLYRKKHVHLYENIGYRRCGSWREYICE